MEIKKAKSQQQKLHRTNTILDAAETLFIAGNGELPSAIEIANQAKIAKGTVYLYFSSKETIFLTLLERHMHNWLLDCDKGIRQYESPVLEDILTYLLNYWLEHPQFGQLFRICDAILEPNVEDKVYAGFHTRTQNEIKRLAPALQAINSDVSAHDWNNLIYQSLHLIGTAWQLSHPQHKSHESVNFVEQASLLLEPFWQELLTKKAVVKKPKSAWRKLLGS